MRYRIVRAYVMCGVVLGIILLQVARPGPAAQTAGPDTVPADCRAMPLPSAMPFALDQYEARLHKFLQAQCYIHLGWTHDAHVRDTGPWIAQFAAPDGDRSQPYQWSISNYGLHGTVLIYYSPDVFRWMQERDTALREGRDLATLRPIADGSMSSTWII